MGGPGCAGTGAASICTSRSISQLLTVTSLALPGLVCSQRAPSDILISFGNWVTGTESGIRVAATCGHRELQVPRPRFPLRSLADRETSLRTTPRAAEPREAVAWSHSVRKLKYSSPRQSDQCCPRPALQLLQGDIETTEDHGRTQQKAEGICVQKTMGLTVLLPHPDGQRLMKQYVYTHVCVCYPANSLTTNSCTYLATKERPDIV